MVKLDKIDRKLLHELDNDARQPDTTLAKKIGRSRESVRYRIEQLKKKKVIRGFSTIIDMSNLGYQGYKSYFNVGGRTTHRDEFYSYVKKQPDLLWMGISEGAWDLGTVFFAKTHKDFFLKQQKISSKFHHLILKKDFALLIQILMFPKKYILNKKEEPVIVFGETEYNTIDDIEKEILEILKDDARITLIDLAKKCNSTIDIVRGRMKKLEKKKIIVKYTVDIDYNVLGLQYFKVFLYFKHLSKSKEAALIQYCRQKKEVINYVQQISSWDVELEVMVEKYQDFNKFIRDLKEDFPDSLIDTESANVSEDYILPGEKVLF